MHLIIAEKALAAKRIAEILSDKQPKVIQEGRVTVYDTGKALVIPLRGHIVNVDFPKAYNNWTKINLHQLVNAPLEYSPTEYAISATLEKYGAKATLVTIATDFDTEGESIGREALNIIKNVNKNVKSDRARFSALTEEEVVSAFKKTKELDINLADAADTRREVDIMWGAVLTRFVSLASGRLGKKFLSVGRVQTPTLALIVNREKERLAFKPKAYWVLTALLHKKIDFESTHATSKFWEKPDLFEKIKNAKTAIVKKIKQSEKKLSPPSPFNTTEFLRAASSIGVSPSNAMRIAETLYQEGKISYPRTDNTVYPKSLKLKEIVQTFESHPLFASSAKKLLSQKKMTPSKGKKKTTDHPPIHPVALASKEKMDAAEWSVYKLIVDRFFATLSWPCVVFTTHVDFDIEKEPFVSTGQIIKDKGWKQFYPYSKSKEVELPDLSEGEEVDVKKMNMDEKHTKPPAQFTPASLIKKMDDLGLGTKSTRPEIISKLLSRDYITGKKAYTPTELAMSLICALEDAQGNVTKSKMTSDLEEEMSQIEGGKKQKDDVVNDSRALLSRSLSELSSKTNDIGATLRKAGASQDVVGNCKCGEELRMITSRKTGKRFVGCSGYAKGCRTSYPLPQKGKITTTDRECSECGAPIVKVFSGKRRSYEMCLGVGCKTKENWGKKK